MNWVKANNRIYSKITLIGVFACLWWSSMSLLSYAQITPQGRDQTYKQAAPQRFEERFKKQEFPKSQVVPVKPDSLKPVFPSGVKKGYQRLYDLWQAKVLSVIQKIFTSKD